MCRRRKWLQGRRRWLKIIRTTDVTAQLNTNQNTDQNTGSRGMLGLPVLRIPVEAGKGVVMKKGLFVIAFFVVIFILCSCGTGQGFYRTEEGAYSHNGQLYKNNGEIVLSEKEREYAELIGEFPEGVEGAEWYTELYRYSDWLLLGIDDGRSLPGMEGYRYFLLVPAAEQIMGEYQMPEGADGTTAAIYYNGALYQYESDETSEDVLNHMEAVGMIQSLDENWPEKDFQTNRPWMLAHLLFEYDGKLLISGNGGKTYSVYALTYFYNNFCGK